MLNCGISNAVHVMDTNRMIVTEKKIACFIISYRDGNIKVFVVIECKHKKTKCNHNCRQLLVNIWLYANCFCRNNKYFEILEFA